MKTIITFGLAFIVAAAAFGITMLTKPPVSVAKPIATVDTYALTLKANPAMAEAYDCN
jgi:hypothetical protein